MVEDGTEEGGAVVAIVVIVDTIDIGIVDADDDDGDDVVFALGEIGAAAAMDGEAIVAAEDGSGTEAEVFVADMVGGARGERVRGVCIIYVLSRDIYVRRGF